jgi:isoleucyl-tRNA synthetase
VFESGWVKLEEEWKKPELAESWVTLRQARDEVNKVLEKARAKKSIGASLDAKVLLYTPEINNESKLKQQLIKLNPQDSLSDNRVDELRYLFLASQVEVVDSLEAIEQADYRNDDSNLYHQLAVSVVKADGEKCDRCWNYSVHIGESAEHPLLCDRCVPALKEEF